MPSTPVDVTVIVPMHNSSKTVAQAIASIARQTSPAVRVIAVDDASSDDSIAVARRAGLATLEVVALEANLGPGGARNAAAALASTEWLAFLDADDEWEPTFLQELSSAVAATGADFAGAGGTREMLQRPPIVRLIEAPAGAADRTADFWRIARRFMPIVPSSAFIRRSLYMRVGGFPEDMRSGEDIVLFARLWLAGRFAFVNRPLYRSAQLSTGLSAAPRSFRNNSLFTARLGATLLRAIGTRRPGTRWFIGTYARRVIPRHVNWAARRVRRR